MGVRGLVRIAALARGQRAARPQRAGAGLNRASLHRSRSSAAKPQSGSSPPGRGHPGRRSARACGRRAQRSLTEKARITLAPHTAGGVRTPAIRLGARAHSCPGQRRCSAHDEGRARSHCRFVPPLTHLTRFTDIFGSSTSEMTTRPNPRRGGSTWRRRRRARGFVAGKAPGWPKRCKLAHAFQWEYS